MRRHRAGTGRVIERQHGKPPPTMSDCWSMIPKKPAPHLMRGGRRFSEKIMLHQ
jgi:hypothetical protein